MKPTLALESCKILKPTLALEGCKILKPILALEDCTNPDAHLSSGGL